MALQNPSNLYRGGLVNLNPMPYVNIINQARAKKQVREDAIDQYYRKLPDTVNDKGIRDQDRPVIEEYRNKIYEYWIKNKDLLRRGDGAAQLEMEKLFREANAAAERSKNLGKRALERGKMYLSKENRWVVDDDEYMAAEDMESKPINDPAHREMDMPALLANKPFDESEFGKEIKGKIKYGTKVVRQTDPTNPLYDIVSEVPNIDPKTAEQIYSFASEKVNGNKRFEKFIKNKTPEQLAELNKISEKVFGHPIRQDFAEEDAAAAYTVLQIPVTSSKEKSQQDIGAVQSAKNKEWDRRNRITFGQSMQKIAANKAAGLPPEELGYVSDEVAAEVGKDLEVEFKGKKSTRRVVFVDDVDPERLNLIIGKDPSKPMQSGVKAIPIKVPQPDGTVIVKKGYYVDYNTGDWEGDNGQKISRERVKDSYINKYAPTKFKAKAGTKGAEQKQTIKGW